MVHFFIESLWFCWIHILSVGIFWVHHFYLTFVLIDLCYYGLCPVLLIIGTYLRFRFRLVMWVRLILWNHKLVASPNHFLFRPGENFINSLQCKLKIVQYLPGHFIQENDMPSMQRTLENLLRKFSWCSTKDKQGKSLFPYKDLQYAYQLWNTPSFHSSHNTQRIGGQAKLHQDKCA